MLLLHDRDDLVFKDGVKTERLLPFITELFDGVVLRQTDIDQCRKSHKPIPAWVDKWDRVQLKLGENMEKLLDGVQSFIGYCGKYHPLFKYKGYICYTVISVDQTEIMQYLLEKLGKAQLCDALSNNKTIVLSGL
jgi:hypothetical protein